MARRTVLLIGSHPFDEAETRGALDPGLDLELLTGTSLIDVERASSNYDIDTVIIGAGVPLDTRIEIVRHVESFGESTTVHIDNGGEMMPFVNGVLTGLTWHQWSWTEEQGAGAHSETTPAAAPRPTQRRPGLLRRVWNYVFGRSEPPYHPPPPPHSPGAGGA